MREIIYSVSENGITPTECVCAGIQGEHNATKIIFNLSDTLLNKKYLLNITDGSGRFYSTDFLTVLNNALTFNIPASLSSVGGVCVLHLCIKDEDTNSVMYSFPAILSFEPSNEKSYNKNLYLKDIADALSICKSSSDTCGEKASAAADCLNKINSISSSVSSTDLEVKGIKDEIDGLYTEAKTNLEAANEALKSHVSVELIENCGNFSGTFLTKPNNGVYKITGITSSNNTVYYTFSPNLSGNITCNLPKEINQKFYLTFKPKADDVNTSAESQTFIIDKTYLVKDVADKQDKLTAEQLKNIDVIFKKSNAELIPIEAPVRYSGAKLNHCISTVTSILPNKPESGKTLVVFNGTSEKVTYGSFDNGEKLTDGTCLTEEKSAYGWSGKGFENLPRYTKIVSGPSPGGQNHLEACMPFTSITKSVTLKPFTEYTFSVWVKLPAASKLNNICIAGKKQNGNVIYTDAGGACWIIDKNNAAYKVLMDKWFHDDDKIATDSWQMLSYNFNTESYPYVDISIYNDTLDVVKFDSFSVTENFPNEEMTVVYNNSENVPDNLKVGSNVYLKRSGIYFERFCLVKDTADKADKNSVYSKDETYKKTEVYSKEEVNNLLLNLKNELSGGTEQTS